MPSPNGIVKGNPQNIPEAHTPRTRSTFPLHQLFPNTHRFGEYIPHYVDDLTKDDKYPIHSSGSVRSYTFKSPLLQNVKRNKDYFLVPMESILPLNWEKFFDNPVRGDDVLDDVGPTVENFWNKVGLFYSSLGSVLRTKLADSSTTVQNAFIAIFRYLIIGEYFYSAGNLLSSLNCHGSPYIKVSKSSSGGEYTFDDFFDAGISQILLYLDGLGIADNEKIFELIVDGYNYPVTVSGHFDRNGYPISLRHALQLMRDNPAFVLSSFNSLIDSTFLSYMLTNFFGDWYLTTINANVHCNLSRLWAYQLCCAHYMSNDHIDFVYSAELYRQLIGNYLMALTFWVNSSTFVRNGITYRYDYLSAHGVSLLLTNLTAGGYPWLILSSIVSNNSAFPSLGFLSALFGYRRSLRYLDYFTGSRAQPLAVVNTAQINTNVAVNANQVSVIDITKSIQAQRFLNSVNRIRHDFEGYLKGIFGGKEPAPDYHNPFWVAHTDDVIFGQETENTADAQMNSEIAITTNLRSNSGNYMFEVTSDRPCIVIGITSYDIARVYQNSMDRSFLHLNRFDWFNPFMQYTGDQQIYLQELGINPSGLLVSMRDFSYTLRHMEFKQKYNYCAGGFCVPSTNLDLWIFPAKDGRGSQANINPDWIRSLNAEFDQFYVSLSGWSLGTYFHFIVSDYNSVNANRPMAYAPQILG